MIVKDQRADGMQATIQGMAVLVVRFACLALSMIALRRLDWRRFFSQQNYYMAGYVYLLVSIAVGHLVGSFFVEVIQVMQQILLNTFS